MKAYRNIKEILYFRGDISPFLIHLTKPNKGRTAECNLEKIIRERKLIAGESSISDARLEIHNKDREKQYCRAISFTETPLNEIHCLLDIAGRSCDLEPYGLVFLKEKLRIKGVAPVFYLNNEGNNKLSVIKALCRLIEIEPESAKQILPLISSFGKKLLDPTKTINFLWEREWRYPSVEGDLQFNESDVFVGICPDGKINHFERLFSGVQFVDCQRNMKWYASKLVVARQQHDMKFSVI